MPQKTWAVGEEVLAADFNTYMQNQVVPAFTGTAQRDTQWISPPDGAMCVTVDTGTRWQRVGSTWYRPNSTLARVVASAQVTGIGTGGYDLTSTSAIAIPAGRRIAVVAHLNFSGSGGGVYTAAKMDGTVQTSRIAQINTLSPTAGEILEGQCPLTPSAGSHTFTISIVGVGGTVTLEGAADPGWYEIRDLGAA